MSFKKGMFLAAFVMVVGLNVSCDKESAAADDQLFEQGIDKDEFENEDT